jgi:hypothetical protein
MDVFKATMAWDSATEDRQSDKASGYVDQLRWGGVIIPAIVGTIGGISLIAGIVLLIRRRSDRPTGGQDLAG